MVESGGGVLKNIIFPGLLVLVILNNWEEFFFYLGEGLQKVSWWWR